VSETHDAGMERAIREAVLDAVQSAGDDISATDAARLRWLAFEPQPVPALLEHIAREYPPVMLAMLTEYLP
jgi:hypothetical protein